MRLYSASPSQYPTNRSPPLLRNRPLGREPVVRRGGWHFVEIFCSMALAAVAFAAWQTYRRSEETYVPGDRWRLIVLSHLVQAPRSQPEKGTGSTLQHSELHMFEWMSILSHMVCSLTPKKSLNFSCPGLWPSKATTIRKQF